MGQIGVETTIIDTDGDTIPDDIDNCQNTANTDQTDLDRNNIGDVCDDDIDGDDILNTNDAFPLAPNEDTDGNNTDTLPKRSIMIWIMTESVAILIISKYRKLYQADLDGDNLGNVCDDDDDDDDDDDEFINDEEFTCDSTPLDATEDCNTANVEYLNFAGFEIFPNSVSDKLTIKTAQDTIKKIVIFDQLGKNFSLKIIQKESTI